MNTMNENPGDQLSPPFQEQRKHDGHDVTQTPRFLIPPERALASAVEIKIKISGYRSGTWKPPPWLLTRAGWRRLGEKLFRS